jgi:hypothetical protein
MLSAREGFHIPTAELVSNDKVLAPATLSALGERRRECLFVKTTAMKFGR